MPDYARYDYDMPNYGRGRPTPGSLEDVLSRESGSIHDGVPSLRRPFPGVDEILEAVDDLENSEQRRREESLARRLQAENASQRQAEAALRRLTQRSAFTHIPDYVDTEERRVLLAEMVAEMEVAVRDYDHPAITQAFEQIKLVLAQTDPRAMRQPKTTKTKKKPLPPAKPVKKSAWERLDDDAFEDE